MPLKRTYEELELEVENFGFKLNMKPDEYKKANKISVICKCGSNWNTELHSLRRGRLCKQCSVERRSFSRKDNCGRFNNFKKFLKDINYTLLNDKSDFLNNATHYVTFKCDQEHENKLTFNSFCNKRNNFKNNIITTFCTRCKFLQEKEDEFQTLKLKAKENCGYNLLDYEIKHGGEFYVKFQCGNCNEIGFTHSTTLVIKNKTKYCIKCLGKSQRLTYNYIMDIIKLRNITPLFSKTEFEYIYTHKDCLLPIQCICGIKYNDTIFNIKHGNVCVCHIDNNNIVKNKNKITNAFKFKLYTFPSGREIYVQGFENICIDYLLKNDTNEVDIVAGDKSQIPVISYCNDIGQLCKYYPDILIKNKSLIEVKSNYTYNKNPRNILLKGIASSINYNFELYIFHKSGKCLEHLIMKNGHVVSQLNNNFIVGEYYNF